MVIVHEEIANGVGVPLQSYDEVLAANQQLTSQLAHTTSLYQKSISLLSDVSGKLCAVLHTLNPKYQFPSPVTAAALASMDMVLSICMVNLT